MTQMMNSGGRGYLLKGKELQSEESSSKIYIEFWCLIVGLIFLGSRTTNQWSRTTSREQKGATWNEKKKNVIHVGGKFLALN